MKWCLLLLAFSCSTLQAEIASTETLDVTGQEFLTVATAMKAANASGDITPAQYQEWVTFGKGFKIGYPAAVKAWEDAVARKDKTAEAAAFNTITDFATKVGVYYVEVGGKL